MSEPSRVEFYRGILLATRAHRSRFMASGGEFHEAFEEMLSAAFLAQKLSAPKLVEELLTNKDPVFGVLRGAEEMILHGMVDLILSLESPRMEIAVFTIGGPQAEKELGELRDADVYREMAKTFNDHLFSTR